MKNEYTAIRDGSIIFLLEAKVQNFLNKIVD